MVKESGWNTWRAANPQAKQAWYDAHPDKRQEHTNKAVKAWRARNPERTAYGRHKQRALARNIPFLLTFDEWWDLWEASGKWEQRGGGADSYCMARYGDVGPYAVGNVRICTHRENNAEQHSRPQSAETRRKRSEALKAYHAH
jgi:hypothetical protein